MLSYFYCFLLVKVHYQPRSGKRFHFFWNLCVLLQRGDGFCEECAWLSSTSYLLIQNQECGAQEYAFLQNSLKDYDSNQGLSNHVQWETICLSVLDSSPTLIYPLKFRPLSKLSLPYPYFLLFQSCLGMSSWNVSHSLKKKMALSVFVWSFSF